MKFSEVPMLLEKHGAVITNSHVVYTSGLHGSAYVNKDAIYPHTAAISRLAGLIAFLFESYKPEVVIAPAVGGCILSNRVAEHLSMMLHQDVLGIYADKTDDGNFVIKRGYDKLIRDKKVLVVEDVLTTGNSAKKVVIATRMAGAHVIGVGAICNRGNVEEKNVGDVPILEALLNVKLDAYEEASCPLCEKGVPINTNVGKGREFIAKVTTSAFRHMLLE